MLSETEGELPSPQNPTIKSSSETFNKIEDLNISLSKLLEMCYWLQAYYSHRPMSDTTLPVLIQFEYSRLTKEIK